MKKSLSLTFGANLTGAALGAMALFIVAQRLSTSDFGLFSIILIVLRTAPLLTAFGFDTSMTTIASSYIRDSKTEEADQLIRATFSFRLLSSALVSFALFTCSGIISEKLFHSHDIAPLLKIASLGVLSASVYNYFKTILWTYQAYKKYFFFQVFSDSGKLLFVAGLALIGRLTPFSAVVVYVLTPFMGILPTIGHFSKKIFVREKMHKHIWHQLFKYAKWLCLSEICRTIFASSDLFIVAYLLGKNATGQYGLASNLIYLFPIFLGALRAVLLPHVSRFSEKEEFRKYIKKSLTYSMRLGLILTPLLFLSRPVILRLFGNRYEDSIPVFNALLLVNMLSPALSAIYPVMFALKKPFIVGITDFVRLLILIAVAVIATPKIGLLGPPLALFIANFASLAFLLSYLSRCLGTYKIGACLPQRPKHEP